MKEADARKANSIISLTPNSKGEVKVTVLSMKPALKGKADGTVVKTYASEAALDKAKKEAGSEEKSLFQSIADDMN